MPRYGCNIAIASRKLDRLQAAKVELEKATGQKCMVVQMDVRQVRAGYGIGQALQAFICYLVGTYDCKIDCNLT